MVEVSPFKGITYNKEKIEDLDKVMCPPYDIIPSEMQDDLYEKHLYNFVRLILGKQKPGDNEQDNRYTRAKKHFEEWIKESILVESDKPAVFPYKINYELDGKKKTMNSFFILLKLDRNYEKVRAHEKTLSGPKKDRLNLMRSCHANLEPIQLLYIDEEDKIRERIDEKIDDSFIGVKGYDGFNHKIWKLEDEDLISWIEEKLNDEILFIADGHHRYQTAINYADEVREKTGNTDPDASFNYRMVILVNMFDEGLSILPTHRLIKKADVDVEGLVQDLEKYFTVEKKTIDSGNPEEKSQEVMKDIETKDEHKFAIYLKDKYYVLTLKDEDIMDNFAEDRSKTWRTLDVSILHKIVIENMMGIDSNNLEDHVSYTREDERAVKMVDNGEFDFSIFMNPTKIEELKKVADAGEHMPQKSTYFLPKMLSGLVAYKM
ncbi:MAG: DUF1015 domain-containing protein [Candidatus Thermoplasmatota archaeon]